VLCCYLSIFCHHFSIYVVLYGLKGIDCPRAARSGPGAGVSQPADEYGEEALTFTRDLVLQREVGFRFFCVIYYSSASCCFAI